MSDFDVIFEFEEKLAKFTGAPYAITTDCCTHAIELCMRYDRVKRCLFPAFTYLSIPMLMEKLHIAYGYTGDDQWVGEYQFGGTRIWDSARMFKPNMYRQGMMQCLSFGHDKPLYIGRGGAILLDDQEAYEKMLRMRWDGRDLKVHPWEEQQTFELGFHYRMTPEEAGIGLMKLTNGTFSTTPKHHRYPDLRDIKIIHKR